MLISIYLFYYFKILKPKIKNVDCKLNKWHNKILFNRRKKANGWKLWSIFNLYIRDPYSYPSKKYFKYNEKSPFVRKIGK